jgi:four helix bundle protein
MGAEALLARITSLKGSPSFSSSMTGLRLSFKYRHTEQICYIIEMAMFDHEKLDVYGLELEFLTWVTEFQIELAQPLLVSTRELRDQLDRASRSAPLNTAEANGRRRGGQQAKAFDDARGSAIECAACLDASVAKRLATADRVKPGKELLVRIVSMLSKLVDRFDSDQYRVRESPLDSRIPFEDEDD